MPIGKLDHDLIRTLDIEALRRSYSEVMDFQAGFTAAEAQRAA